MREGDCALLSARTEEGQVFPTCPKGQIQPVRVRWRSVPQSELRHPRGSASFT